jgi:crotonobetainyl-CoA:carnitine CoA-transferase CaiB-like acyl-CoA transferase
METKTRGALTGIRVIELADEQAEYCGLTLAGLGADVIKVEPPGGNSTRRIGPFYQDREDPECSLFFWQYNRGKRSVVLDLRQREIASASARWSPPPTCYWSRRQRGTSTGWAWAVSRCCASSPP